MRVRSRRRKVVILEKRRRKRRTRKRKEKRHPALEHAAQYHASLHNTAHKTKTLHLTEEAQRPARWPPEGLLRDPLPRAHGGFVKINYEFDKFD